MTRHLYDSADDCYAALKAVAVERGYTVSGASGKFADFVLVASKQSRGPVCYGASCLVLVGQPSAFGLWSAWF